MKSVRIKTAKGKRGTARTVGLVRGAKAKKREPKAEKAASVPATPAEPRPEPEQQFHGTLAELEEFVDNIRAERAAREPKPERVTPFDCGEPNRKASLLTLVRAMFDGIGPSFGDPAADFMANVLLSVSDEVELLHATDDQLDRSATIDRAAMRVEWRARLAVEIARRIEAGEVSS